MKTIITILVVIALAIAGYFLYQNFFVGEEVVSEDTQTEEDGATDTDNGEAANEAESVIGRSADGNDITAYHFGKGDTELLFVGGIHGGYSWNTVLVSYQLMDYLEANPTTVPENVRVTVIPVLNPDGLEEVVGTTGRFTAADVPSGEGATVPGRFNGNEVDLNRNFDCDWQAEGTWQNRTVSGGTAAFSEPEAQAVRDYVAANNPEAVVVYYSSAGGVFASNCHGGVLPRTTELTNLYADASGYQAFEEFDFYEITGDMTNWLASKGVPAISVLLTDHRNTEWSKNRAGVEALLKHYAE